MSSFKVATCQFPVSRDIKRNSDYIQRMMVSALEQGAGVVRFPEGALSGYARTHFDTWDGFDWDLLVGQTEKIIALARDHGLWVLLGSSHRLSGDHLPHNSVYAINPQGEICERFDKLFCTEEDLNFYTPGDHFSVFEIEGMKCGVLICHDVRYPELYRRYYTLGVRCLFHSFYNASSQGRTIHTIIMRPTLQARAATNHFWISVSNASGYYQGWSSVFIVPDGRIVGSLRRHRMGVMINCVDTEEEFVDKCSFRDLAVQGILHSGTPVDDPRSRQRDTL